MNLNPEVSAGVNTLRGAKIEDAPRVAECVNAAYSSWIPRIGRKPWPMLQDYRAIIQSERVFVAEAAGEIVGVLVLSDTNAGLLIENVAVFPAWKGKGVGKALLIHAEEEAKSMGYSSVYLYTNEKMSENIALYAKVGYVEYERRQELGFCRVFMRKGVPQ